MGGSVYSLAMHAHGCLLVVQSISKSQWNFHCAVSAPCKCIFFWSLLACTSEYREWTLLEGDQCDENNNTPMGDSVTQLNYNVNLLNIHALGSLYKYWEIKGLW